MARKWLILSTALLLAFASACSNADSTNEPDNTGGETQEPAVSEETEAQPPADPFGKYPELIEVTTVRPISSNDPKFPEGESWEDNAFNRFMEEQLNVKPKILWSAPQDGQAYEKKLDLAMATNEIPEVFRIVAPTITELQAKVKRLVAADMIEDLSVSYERYASPEMREAYSSEGNAALELFTYDGKLYALPEQKSLEDFNFVWVREDWRKELNLPEPSTLDDVIAIAKAFKDQDPAGGGKTIPIAMQMQTETSGLFGPGFVFDQFEAFPDMFYKNQNGELVYGGIEQNAKEAIKVLSQLYKDGLIEKDFALKDTGKVSEIIGSGNAGMIGMPWWGVWWPLFMTLQTDPNADWMPYAIPSQTSGKLTMKAKLPILSVTVVKKGFAHPELPIKWANVYNANRSSEFFIKTKQELYKDANEKNPIWLPILVGKTDEIMNQANDIVAAVNGEKDAAALPFQNQDAYNHIKSYIDELQKEEQAPSKHMLQWQNTRSWYHAMGGAAKHEMNTIYSAFDGRTPTMEKKMTALNELVIKEYHKMIMGDVADIDAAFEQLINDWKAQGGDEIMQEINEQISGS